MSPVVLALLPDFLVLVAGGVLRKSVPVTAWQGIDRLNFVVLFPALIFLSAARSQPRAMDLAVMGPGIWCGMLVAGTLAWLVRGLGPQKYLDFAGMWQAAWRFNTAIAVVAAQALPAEHRGLMSIAIGLGVPFANILAIAALSRGQGGGWKATLGQVVSNPFFLASVAGIAYPLLEVRLPDVLMSAIAKLAQAALPMALLSVGAAVNWRALARMDLFEALMNAIKLVVMPAIVFAVASWIGIGNGTKLVLTIFSALPTASGAHVLASIYGADRARVATLIAQSTLLGCFTLPLWLIALL